MQAFQTGRSAPALASRTHRTGAIAAQPTRAPAAPQLARRDALLATASAAVLATLPFTPTHASASGAAPDDYAVFKPDRSKTPALRAGTVDRENPYSFVVPSNWKERKVPNIQSGNYCQPRCAEPWTEVVFGDDAEGKASVIVAPLVRFTNKKDAKIEDIGSPEGILGSIGAFITGTYLDQEDVLEMKTEKRDDGLTYYYYNVYATQGLNGPHTITTATVKGDLVLLFSTAANDKQYSKGKKKMETMVQSFRA